MNNVDLLLLIDQGRDKFMKSFWTKILDLMVERSSQVFGGVKKKCQ